MTLDYVLGALLLVALVVYLSTALVRPESSEAAIMTVLGWAQIALYVAVIAAIVRPFGGFIHRVVQGERTWLSPVFVPVERGFTA